jgi:hypothetical protein
MTVPGAIWAALATIVAAVVAGFISLINLLIAKDQKITEFRQNWIDKLREEIAALISQSIAISSMRHVIEARDKSATEQAALDDMRDLLKGVNAQRMEHRNRILLMLNPKDDAHLIAQVHELSRISAISSNVEHTVVVRHCDALVAESQRLLKQEWIRVKRGEWSYRVIKCFVVVVTLLLAAAVALVLWHLAGDAADTTHSTRI